MWKTLEGMVSRLVLNCWGVRSVVEVYCPNVTYGTEAYAAEYLGQIDLWWGLRYEANKAEGIDCRQD